MKQKFKVLLLLLLVITLVLPISAKADSVSTYYGSEISTEQKKAINKISTSYLNKQGDLNIIVGKTKSVKLIFPEELDTNGVTVTYKSSNSKIASVSQNGKLTAKSK